MPTPFQIKKEEEERKRREEEAKQLAQVSAPKASAPKQPKLTRRSDGKTYVNLGDLTDESAASLARRMKTDEARDAFLTQYISHVGKKTSANYRTDAPTLDALRGLVDSGSGGAIYASTKASIAKTSAAFDGMIDVTGGSVNMNTADLNTVIRSIRATADKTTREARAKALIALTKTQGSRFYGATIDEAQIKTFLDSAQLTSEDYNEYIEDFAAVFSPQPGKEAENREAYGKLRTQIEALEDGYLRQTYLTALDKAYRSQTASDTLPDMAAFAREQEAAAQEAAAKQAEQGEDWLEKLIKKLIPPIEGVYETEEMPKSAPPASVPVVTQEAGTYSLTNLMPTEDGAQLLPDPAPLEEEDEKKRGMPDVGAIMEEYGGRGADLGIGGSTAHSGTVDLTGDLAQAWGYKRSGRFNELTRGTQMELAKMAGEPGVQAWMGYIDDNSFWRFAYVAPDDTPETDADNPWYEAGNERADSIETGSLHMSLGAKMLGIYAKINADDFPEDLRNMAFMTGVQLLRSANEWQIESGFVAEDGSNVYDAYIAEHPNDPAWFSLNYAIQLSEARKEEARRAQEESANAQARDAQKQLEIDRAAYESRNYTQQQYDNVRSNAPELTRLVLRSDERYVELFNEIDDEWLDMDTRWMTDTVLSPAVRISGDAEYVEGQRGTYESIAHEYLENALLSVTQIAYSLGYDSLAAYEKKHGEVTLEALHSMATLDMQRFASSITQEDVDAVREIAQQTQYSGTGEGVSAWDVAGSGMATGASDAVSGMLGGFYTMTANTNLPNDIARARIIYNKEFGFFAETQLKADLLEMAQGGYFPQEGMGEYITEYLNAGGNPFSLGIVPGDFEFARKTAVKYREVGDAYRAWAKESMRANQGKWFDRIAGSTDNSVRMLASSLMTLGTGSKVLGLVVGYGMSSYAEGAEGIYAQDAQYIRETGTLPTTSTMKWANVAGLLQMSATVASEYVTFGKWLGNVAGFGALKSSAKAGLEKLGASGTARLMKGLAAFSKSFGKQMWDEVFVDETTGGLLSYGAEEATDRLRALDENGTLSLIRGIDEMLMSAGAAIYHTDEVLGKVVQNAPEMAWVVGLTSILGAGGAMHAAMKETYEAAEKAVQTGDPRDIAAFTQTCHQEIAGASEEQLAAADAALTDTQIAETAVGIAVTDPEIAAQIEDAADAQRQAAAHRESRDASAAQAKAGFESVAAALDDIDAGDTSPEAVGRVADGMDAVAKGKQGEAEHERARKAKQDAADKGFTQAMHEATDKASAQVQAQKQAAQAQLDEAYAGMEADESYVRGIEEKLGVETKRKNTRPTPAVVNDGAQSEQAAADQPDEAERQARRKPPQEAYADDGESETAAVQTPESNPGESAPKRKNTRPTPAIVGDSESETTAVQTPESKPEESVAKRKNTRPTPAVVDDGETDAKPTGMTKGEAVADVVAEKVLQGDGKRVKPFEPAYIVEAVYGEEAAQFDEQRMYELAKKIIGDVIMGSEEAVSKLREGKDVASKIYLRLKNAASLLGAGVEARMVNSAAAELQTGEVKRKNLRSAAVTADDGETAKRQERMAQIDARFGEISAMYEANPELEDPALEEEAERLAHEYGALQEAQEAANERSKRPEFRQTAVSGEDAQSEQATAPMPEGMEEDAPLFESERQPRKKQTEAYADDADFFMSDAEFSSETAQPTEEQIAREEEARYQRQEYARMEMDAMQPVFRWLSATGVYVNDSQKANILHATGLKSLQQVNFRYGFKLTNDAGKGAMPLDGHFFAQIAEESGGRIDADALHPEDTLIEIGETKKRLRKDMQASVGETIHEAYVEDAGAYYGTKDPVTQQMASDIYKSTGLTVVVAPLANRIRAVYDRQNGRVILSNRIGAGLAKAQAAMHELTHFIETSSGYEAYKKAALDAAYFGDTDGVMQGADAEQIRDTYADSGIVLDEAGVESELVAQATEKILSDQSGEIVRKLIGQGKRGFVVRLKNLLMQFLARRKAKREGRLAQYDAIQNAYKLFKDALESRGKWAQGEAGSDVTVDLDAAKRHQGEVAYGAVGEQMQYALAPNQFGNETAQRMTTINQTVRDVLSGSEHEVVTNQAQLDAAWEKVNADGLDTTAGNLLAKGDWDAQDNAAAALCMVLASQRGDETTAAAIAMRLDTEGTKQGQALQVRQMFLRLTPEGAMGEMIRKAERINQGAGIPAGSFPIGEGAPKTGGTTTDEATGTKTTTPPKAQAVYDEAESLQEQLDALPGDVSTNNPWGLPLADWQMALIKKFRLMGVKLPGINYNIATKKQRMLAAIIATDQRVGKDAQKALCQQLVAIDKNRAVVTAADLRYEASQIAEFKALEGADATVPTTQAGREALGRAMQAQDNIIPVGFLKKWASLRYLNMLSAPATAVRNVTSNVLSGGLEAVSTGIATAADISVAKKTGNRTTSLPTKAERSEANRAFAAEIARTISDYLIAHVDTGHGRKYDVGGQGRVFETEWLEACRNFVDFTMQIGDRPFYEKTYAQELAIIKRLGMKTYETKDGKRVQRPMTEAEMHAEATVRALHRVYQENSEMAEIVAKLRGMNPTMDLIISALVPFVKTPTNVAMRAMEYSPVGLANALIRRAIGGIDTGAFGSISQRDYVMGIGRGLTGTGLLTAGVLLAAAGYLKFGRGEEENKNRREVLTSLYEPYGMYIEIGGQKREIDWALPASAALATGAELVRNLDDGEGFGWALALAIVSGLGDQLMDTPMLSGLSEIFRGYDDTEDMLIRLVKTEATSLMNQTFSPSIIRAIAKATDPYVRDTSSQSEVMSILNGSVVQYWPLLRQMLPAKTDITGEKMLQSGYYSWGKETQNAALHMLDSFFTPTATIGEKNDEALFELLDLSYRLQAEGESFTLPAALVGENGRLNVTKTLAGKTGTGDAGYTIQLTDDQRREANRLYGDLLFNGMRGVSYTMPNGVKKYDASDLTGIRVMMESGEWAALTDKERADRVDKMRAKAKEIVTLMAIRDEL